MKEAPEPSITPALLGNVSRLELEGSEGRKILDQDVDVSSGHVRNFLSDAWERVEVGDVSLYGYDAGAEERLELSCAFEIADYCYHEVLGVTGELSDPFELWRVSLRLKGEGGEDGLRALWLRL